MRFNDYYYSLDEGVHIIHNDVLYAHEYVSKDDPRFNEYYKRIRDISYAIKDKNNINEIKDAAQEMSKFVKSNNILVPIPNSKGDTSANLTLAKEISKITGAQVSDILSLKNDRDSNLSLHKSGKPRLHPQKLGMVLKDKINNNDVLFIDNVLSSGSTIRAAINLINGGNGLVFSKVKNTGKY